GSRTPVSGLRTRSPGPLDDGGLFVTWPTVAHRLGDCQEAVNACILRPDRAVGMALRCSVEMKVYHYPNARLVHSGAVDLSPWADPIHAPEKVLPSSSFKA